MGYSSSDVTTSLMGWEVFSKSLSKNLWPIGNVAAFHIHLCFSGILLLYIFADSGRETLMTLS